MMKCKRVLSCLFAAVLVFGIMPLSAFAYVDDGAGEQSLEATTDAADPGEDASADADAEQDSPFSYTISEDGSITILINGQEWELDGEDTEENTTTGKVVTQGSRLNLRTGAGMNYEIIDQLRPGEEVTVIGTEGDWYKVTVPEKTGYVHSDYLELLEKAEDNSEIDATMLLLLLSMMFQNMETEVPQQSSFTPSGNLSLVDDILQTEVYATEDTELKEKQFITLQSKSGNYFYLVIDRTGDIENVYFMNLVDEADLMALIEDGDTADAPVCVCTEKCAVGAIHTGCEICRTNMSECAGKEPEPEPTVEPTEPVEDPEETKSNTIVRILVLALIGGGGAFAYIKFFKDKPNTKGNADLDDYDYGDDDDEEIPWESEDDDAADDETSGDDQN